MDPQDHVIAAVWLSSSFAGLVLTHMMTRNWRSTMLRIDLLFLIAPIAVLFGPAFLLAMLVMMAIDSMIYQQQKRGAWW